MQHAKTQLFKTHPYKFNVRDYKSHSLQHLYLKTPQTNMELPK